MPANERLRPTHAGAGMRTVADPSRHSRHPAAITDGGGTGVRHAISARLRGRPSCGVCLRERQIWVFWRQAGMRAGLGVGQPDSRGRAWTVAVVQARPGTAWSQLKPS